MPGIGLMFLSFVAEGDNDSGVDESTQGNVSKLFTFLIKVGRNEVHKFFLLDF